MIQTLDKLRKREGLELAALALALLFYISAFVVVSLDIEATSRDFDLRIILVLSAILATLTCFTDSVRVFAVLHSLRFMLLFMAMMTLWGSRLSVELLVLVPFLVDTALYVARRPALVIGFATLAATLVADLIAAADNASRIERTLVIALSGSLIIATGTLLTRYRDQIVVEKRTVRKLDEEVANLIRANRAYQDYADTIEVLTEEQERNRVSRELHDVIGYALTNIIMMMNAGKVLSRDSPQQLDALFEQARSHADEALQESRRILYALRSITPTSRKGLNAIHHLVNSFQAATGVTVEISYGNLPNALSPDIETAIFRLIQESLTNSLRHGHAKIVRISFWLSERDLQVIVWDDGRTLGTMKEGIGINGMRERFAELGGSIEARQASDGFKVKASIPMGGDLYDRD